MFNASIEGFVVLKPNSNGLYAAREQVRCVANGLCISPDDADYLLIEVGEAISNAYRHGSPNPATDLIRLSWHKDTSGLIITIKDNGRGFSAAQHLCASKRSGALARGIELMRACADDVHLISDNGAKVVLRKQVKLRALP